MMKRQTRHGPPSKELGMVSNLHFMHEESSCMALRKAGRGGGEERAD